MIKKYRCHPIQIVANIWKLLILLIIPIIRGLFNAFTGDLVSWLSGAWFDISIVLVILGLGIIQWYCKVYYADNTGITLEQGILIKKTSFIPKENILSLVVTKSFFLRPFNALRVRADTLGGSFKNADFNVLLTKKQTQILKENLSDKNIEYHNLYKTNLIYVIALSLITSNSFAGILIITTFISNLGEALGKELSERIYDTFHLVSQKLAFGIPPAAANIAFLLFIGWFVTFVKNVIKYRNLTVSKNSRCINVKGGIFTVNDCNIAPRSFICLDIRQTLLTKMMGIHSIFVHAIGLGKYENDVSALIPGVKSKHLNMAVKDLSPKFIPTKPTLKPNLGAILRFIADPLYFCISIPLITYILILIYPDWRDFLLSIAALPMVAALWFLVVRIIDLFTSGISKKNGCYTIRCSKGFYFHTVIIPKEKIAAVKTRQSIFQKLDKRCDVFIYTCSEGITMYRCRNLLKPDVLKIFKDI